MRTVRIGVKLRYEFSCLWNSVDTGSLRNGEQRRDELVNDQLFTRIRWAKMFIVLCLAPRATNDDRDRCPAVTPLPQSSNGSARTLFLFGEEREREKEVALPWRWLSWISRLKRHCSENSLASQRLWCSFSSRGISLLVEEKRTNEPMREREVTCKPVDICWSPTWNESFLWRVDWHVCNTPHRFSRFHRRDGLSTMIGQLDQNNKSQFRGWMLPWRWSLSSSSHRHEREKIHWPMSPNRSISIRRDISPVIRSFDFGSSRVRCACGPGPSFSMNKCPRWRDNQLRQARISFDLRLHWSHRETIDDHSRRPFLTPDLQDQLRKILFSLSLSLSPDMFSLFIVQFQIRCRSGWRWISDRFSSFICREQGNSIEDIGKKRISIRRGETNRSFHRSSQLNRSERIWRRISDGTTTTISLRRWTKNFVSFRQSISVKWEKGKIFRNEHSRQRETINDAISSEKTSRNARWTFSPSIDINDWIDLFSSSSFPLFFVFGKIDVFRRMIAHHSSLQLRACPIQPLMTCPSLDKFFSTDFFPSEDWSIRRWFQCCCSFPKVFS